MRDLSSGGQEWVRFRVLVGSILLLPLALPVSHAEESIRSRTLTARLSSPWSGDSTPTLSLFVKDAPLNIRSVERAGSGRPILLLVDPESYRSSELRKRIAALVKGILARSDRPIGVRIGFPIVDGVLSPTFSERATIAASLDAAVANYLPEGMDGGLFVFPRVLDLFGSLVQRAEKESGPLDCLLIARDRRFGGEGVEALTAGAIRHLTDSSVRVGSSFYGWLEGAGLLAEICRSSGGVAIAAEQPGEAVAKLLLDSRSGAFLVRFETREWPFSGRAPLAVRARGRDGHELGVRAPLSFYDNPDGTTPPNLFHMRQALDWLRRARDAHADENLTIAQRAADAALLEDTWNPDVHFVAGETAARAGDYRKAADHLRRALRFDSAGEHILISFGAVYRKLGIAAEAYPALLAAIERGNVATPGVKLELARLLSASKRDGEARVAFEHLVAQGQDSEDVRLEYGEILLRLRDLPRAREQFQGVLQKSPSSSSAMIHLSKLSEAEGKESEAMDLAARALRAQPRDPDVHIQLGRLYENRKDYGAAADAYRSVITLAPGRREFVHRLSDVLVRADRIGEAIALARQSLEEIPEEPTAYRTLAGLQLRNGEVSETVRVLETGAARASAENEALYRAAAEMRERRGELGQALLDYRAMLRSAPSSRAHDLEQEMAQHLAALALLVHGDGELASVPMEKTSRVAELLAPLIDNRAPGSKPAVPAARWGTTLIPGGLAVLSKALGLDLAQLKEQDAMQRVLAHIIEVTPIPSNRAKENPLRRDALLFLESYENLVRHMKKEGFLQPDADLRQSQEFVFPLVGSATTEKKAQRLLAYFGVNIKTKVDKRGAIEVVLMLKQNRSMTARQQLLRYLGVNILDSHLKDIRFTLHNQEVPILFSEETWSSSLLGPDKSKAPSLLGRILSNPNAMQLYLALASCSGETREGLVRGCARGELLTLAPLLMTFGRFIDFKQGSLVVPGLRLSWEKLLNVPSADDRAMVLALLRHDQGRALFLYSSLAGAASAVQQFVSSSPEVLKKFYATLIPFEPRLWSMTAEGMGRFDLGRVLRQVDIDSHGLVVRVPYSAGSALVTKSSGSGSTGDKGESHLLHLDPEAITTFLGQRASPAVTFAPTPIQLVEFLKYAEQFAPELVTDPSLAAILKEPGQTLLMLDLIWDLHPGPDLVSQYLNFCREIAQKGNRGWNVNRTRSAQALLHLLSLLCREGAISRLVGLELCRTALERMASQDESTFAQAVAEFLEEKLLPALSLNLSSSKDTQDPVLSSLAGTRSTKEFSFEGKQLQLDVATYRYLRMQAAIQQQLYNPISRVLQVYRILRDIKSGVGLQADHLQSLVAALSEFKSAEFALNAPESLKQSVAYVDIESWRRRLDALVQGSGRGRLGDHLSSLATELGATLHPELGVTLLSYCYAYYGAPEADALAFDANFVRKHDFYGKGYSAGTGWFQARLEQKDVVGSYCLGTVSGLGSELSRLETAQSVQSFGRRDGRSLVPTILTGMRAVHRSRRSDRAQEYVALTVSLGREVLAISSFDPETSAWSDEFLSRRVSPLRREEALRLARVGNPQAAAAVLSPSELLLFGDAYRRHVSADQETPPSPPADNPLPGYRRGFLQGAEDTLGPSLSADASAEAVAPKVKSPALRRLQEIIPKGDAVEARSFAGEVGEYGMLVRARFGLNQLSFAVADSYEQLESQARSEVLAERICDLKIRIAELNYALGLPASVAEVQGELAIRDILSQSEKAHSQGWRLALEQIGRLNAENARNWMEELLNRGIVNAVVKPSQEQE